MTEDQRAMSFLLELLHSARGLPVTGERLAADLRACGYRNDISGILRRMKKDGLLEEQEDGIGILRYRLTKAGKEAFDSL
jgi:hypothetical protein